MKNLREQEIAFLSKQNAREMSPTNSVGSFEFINANSSNQKDTEAAVASYEKSWESSMSPIILLERSRNNCKENTSNQLIKLIGRNQLNNYKSNRQNRPSSLLLFDNNNNNNNGASTSDVEFVRAYLEKCKQQQQQDKKQLLISTINNQASSMKNSIASSSSVSSGMSNSTSTRKHNHVEKIFGERSKSNNNNG